MNAIAPTLDATATTSSQGMPFRWFTDPAIFDLEMERIFRGSWQFAGATTQIPAPGDFFTYTHIPRMPVIVSRDEHGVINAFVNTCLHRGSVVVAAESGHQDAFSCPYHGWIYGLDGCLIRAPRSRGNVDLGDDLRLYPLRTHVVGPLIFVNADPSPPDFDELYGESFRDLQATVDLSTFDAGIDFRRWEYEGNWKSVFQNYAECYHCPTVHPETLVDRVDFGEDSVDYEINEYFAKQWDYTPRDLNGKREPIGPFVHHWPNFSYTLGLEYFVDATGTSLFVITHDPVTPELSVQRGFVLWTKYATEEKRSEFLAFMDRVMPEDEYAVKLNQMGLSSGLDMHEHLLVPRTDPVHSWLGEHVRRSISPGLAKAGDR